MLDDVLMFIIMILIDDQKFYKNEGKGIVSN